MKIGTDIDMQTNIYEGYQIMEFKKRELFTKGKLNKGVYCRFYRYFPYYTLYRNAVGVKKIYEDIELCADDLWELYHENKEGIDFFIGDSHKYPICEYDMLRLASDISLYCGLE